MADYKEMVKKSEETVNSTLASLRGALTEKDLEKYAATKKVLNEQLLLLNKAIVNETFSRLLKEEKPYVAAINEFYVDTYRVKEEIDHASGTITGVKLDKKQARIDLAKFADFAEDALPTTWIKNAARLLQLLQLRETDVMAMSPADLAKKSYFFISVAKAKMDGETPDSNTKIVRLLQSIIDELIGNTYRCTNHDIAFIQECAFTFDAKNKAGIKSINERTFQTVILSVAHRCLTNGKYNVKNQKISSLAD